MDYKGDTLSFCSISQIIYHLFGRSFKYHRPRGLLSAGSEEPNGIVQLESGNITEPNRRMLQKYYFMKD